MCTVKKYVLCKNVYSAKIWTLQKYILCKNVYCAKMCTVQKCVLLKNVDCAKMCTVQKCILCKNLYSAKCVLFKNVYCAKLCTMQKCVLCKNVYCAKICICIYNQVPSTSNKIQLSLGGRCIFLCNSSHNHCTIYSNPPHSVFATFSNKKLFSMIKHITIKIPCIITLSSYFK